MIQQTTLDAWDSIQDELGERQLQVLSLFRQYPEHSFNDTELSIRLGLPINCITPRRLELQLAGYIYHDGYRILHYAKRSVKVMTFRLKNNIWGDNNG